MNVLGLPGRDAATEAWLGTVIRACGLPDGDSIVQRYGCWDTGGDFDLAAEVARACATAAGLVIAKSMGTRVAIHAVDEGLSAAEFVLIGVPLAAYGPDEIPLLTCLCERRDVLIIQQTDDFLGGFEQVRRAVDCERASFAEVPGADHVYSDVDELGRLVRAWRQPTDT